MLRDSLIDNHQPNETILVYGVGDDGGYTTVGFHQLGSTREEIAAEYAPKLSPWLHKYLPPSSQPGDDLTDAELAARYYHKLTTLHAPLLAGPEGGKERVQRFERIRKKSRVVCRWCHPPLSRHRYGKRQTPCRGLTL